MTTLAQSSIEIYTNNPNAAFRAYFNGIQQNNFHQKHIRFDSLSAEVYQLRLVFQGDSIADIVEEVKLFNNDKRIYRVEQIDQVNKGFSKFGRKIGRLLNNETKDTTNYVEYFYLRDVSTNSPFLNQ